MRQTRNLVIVALIIAAAAAAGCSSSSSTAPSAASLARLFDSAATADAGTNREEPEALLTLVADEGARPTQVSVTTDAGTRSMEVIALEVVDTSTTGSGLATDSISVFLGYSADFSTYLFTEFENVTGNASQVPPTRITGSRALVDRVRAIMRAGRTPGRVTIRSGPSVAFAAVLVQGDSMSTSDSSSSMTSTESAVSGACAWQHVDLTSIFSASIDSALGCSRVRITQSFALHFPANAGIDASLAHLTVTGSSAVGPRVIDP